MILLLLLCYGPLDEAAEQLSDDKYQVRQQATAYLDKHATIRELIGIKANVQSLEATWRVNHLLQRKYRLLLPDGAEDYPMLLCLPEEWGDRTRVLDKWLPFVEFDEIRLNFYWEHVLVTFMPYREATRKYIVHLIEEENKTEEDIRYLLQLMVHNEYTWKQQSRYWPILSLPY